MLRVPSTDALSTPDTLARPMLQRWPVIRSLHSTTARWAAAKHVKLRPPMNSDVFSAVAKPLSAKHPSSRLRGARYRFRWDWHLRHFLMSLLPPAFAMSIALWAKYSFADELAQVSAGRTAGGPAGGFSSHVGASGKSEGASSVQQRPSAVDDEEFAQLKREVQHLKEIVDRGIGAMALELARGKAAHIDVSSSKAAGVAGSLAEHEKNIERSRNYSHAAPQEPRSPPKAPLSAQSATSHQTSIPQRGTGAESK